MSSQDFVKLVLQVTTMLGFAVLFGEVARRCRQPPVVGEMLGGIVLGPTIFGWLAPPLYEWLFVSSAHVSVVRDAAIKLGMLFFLFYAGLAVNFSDLRVLGRRAVMIGVIATVLPIAAGVGLVYALPAAFWGPALQDHFSSFALFVGINLANSANPVIARILVDLGLLDRPIGALIMSATVIDDLVNWTLFAIILNDMAPHGAAPAVAVVTGPLLVLALFVILLGVGRWLSPTLLTQVPRRLAWPNGYVAVIAVAVLLAGGAAEALGLHGFLGAFLLGVAVGGPERRHQARAAIEPFVMCVAPIFFVSMGLTMNFITHFDPLLVAVVLLVACVSKIGSVLAGAAVSGMRVDREVWAVGFGLNARGATGIVLAGVGLANGVIDARIFVAMVVMALLTSMMAGPMMRCLLGYPEAGTLSSVPLRPGRPFPSNAS